MRIKLFVLMAIIIAVFTGCNKEDNPDNELIEFYYSVVDYDDYSDNAIMKLYKGNQLLYELPRMSSVIVKGNSLYAAIRKKTETSCKLYLWKDGVKLFEIPGQNIMSGGTGLCGLCLDGTDIITTCTEQTLSDEGDMYRIGKVWRNDQFMYTLASSDSAWYKCPVNQPVVVGQDLYVAGYIYYPYVDQAVVWRNGEIVFMSEGYEWDCMYGVGYYNGGVYYYGSAGSPGEGGPHGKIWKNGVAICDVKEKNWAKYGEINDAIIYNGDVYAAGYIHIDPGQESDEGNTGNIGVVWKNGEILYEFAERYLPMSPYLNDGDTRSWVELNSINIIDGDVFVSGHVFGNSSGLNVAKIWKNGVEYQGVSEGIYGPGMTVTLLKNGMVYQNQL